MRWIMTKLRSQEGASVILALLFFLLCVMVGASVLAAASSNAGKAAERRKEQQEYFTVSSALQLVCDRLANAEYEATVSVSAEPVTKTPVPGDSYTYTKTTYEQKTGTVNTNLNTILPELKKELDYLFTERCGETECNGYHGKGKFELDNTHTHSTLGGSDVSTPTEHSLKIKVDAPASPSPTGLPSDALVNELTKEVEVKVRLGKFGAVGEEKYWFFVEAKLDNGKFVVKAELKPENDFPHINKPDTYNGPYPGQSSENRKKLNWKLVRIYKKLL